MIEFQQVYKSYGRGIDTLADVNFGIAAGEFVFVSGPSGAGKSTLLKLISGLDVPTRGTILVNGQNVGKLPGRARPYFRRAVGTILQDVHLLQDRNAFENVLFPLIVTGHSRAAAEKRARAAIDKVGLANKDKLRPQELSGGDQQRLAIARAIVNRPALLIVDEPTANLDRDSAQRIADVFRDFNQVGVTTVIATHDESLIDDYAHRVLHIEGGRLTDLGARTPRASRSHGARA
ncbi:GMP synthase [Pigmentiphaga litoralis]|jgi:cell division transport system ATP-binding protein|uniref:cell division ATP-binding protein FtsE n=1 Tax=Pigmentiphaga litoralis TaxID=516702 RepID=UPI0016768BAC|nr:ATP-binding cassette domain-containing protein [Pigmentiphaga litoralis]GGX25782.1 GMP synthase [Pigmentiphaga litoralis]